jgi:hypothetical protein
MNVSLHVLDGMIYNLMQILWIQSFIGFQGVRKDFGSRFNVFPDVGLKRFLSAASGD